MHDESINGWTEKLTYSTQAKYNSVDEWTFGEVNRRAGGRRHEGNNT